MDTFGSMTVAAITTAYRVDMVLLLPVINLTTGISTLTSQNIGAGRPDRAQEVLKAGSKLMAAIAAMAIVGRIAMFIGSAMIGLGQGFQPVSAYNYGARKFARLRKSFFFTRFRAYDSTENLETLCLAISL